MITAHHARGTEAAARMCASAMSRAGTTAIPERACAYVSDDTWQQLVQRHRNRGCGELARLARAILNGKERLHDAVGFAAGGILGWMRRSRPERLFAEELARRIPLPVDAQLAAAARGLQLAGIYLCFIGDGNLADCACLRDVLRKEGEAQLGQLVNSAAQDWQRLPYSMQDITAP